MEENGNDVQIFLWKILKFSSQTIGSYAVKYPFVSFTLLFLFLLYLIFPPVFWFFIYLFPFTVSTAVILRIFPSLRKTKEHKGDEKKNDGKASGTIAVRNGKKLVHVRSVRRRRAKEIKNEDDSQNNVEEKCTIFSTSINHDLVDKRAFIEEKEIREVGVDSSSSPNLSQTSFSSTSKSLKPISHNSSYEVSEKFNLGGSEIGTPEDSEEEDESREEAGSNKAVEWTADDQKNLMDLGISEIERNKRLESLIARRKARKLFSLTVRKTLRNIASNDPIGQIAHITIPKNNPLLPNSSGQFSPGPGSAPSILLPMRNPFDLPYDPCEEKPDLTGDSFHQEFMAVQNKDIMFCRHESFSLGASVSRDFMHDSAEASDFRDFGFRQRASKGIGFSKPGSRLDRELNRIEEPEPYQEPEPETNVDSAGDQIKEVIQVCEQEPENHKEEDNVQPIPVDDDINGGPSSSSSSEDDEPFHKIDKDAILKSIASPATRIIPEDSENNTHTSEASTYDGPHIVKTRSEERMYYANRTLRHRARPVSIASDLQVEFSEVSSPRTIDENLSSQDEEISIYDVDLDKEINSSSEDLWAASSHLSGIDENESRSREVHEVSEKDIIEVGFSRIRQSRDKTLSNKLAEKVNGQSFSPPKTDFPKNHGDLQKCLASAQETSSPCEKLKSELNAIHELNTSENRQDDIGNHIEPSSPIDSETTESSDNGLKKVVENEDIATTSTPLEGHNGNNVELLQRSEDEPRSSNVGTSGTSHESDDCQTSLSPANVSDEQTTTSPISCSSPQSVLQPNFSVDNLSEFQQIIQREVGQFDRVVGVSGELLSQSSMPSEDSNRAHNVANMEQLVLQMQNSALREDAGDEGQVNYPMDHAECSNAATFEATKDELLELAEDRTPISSSVLVEENDKLGTHKNSEEDGEEAMHHANALDSTLSNEVISEINTSNEVISEINTSNEENHNESIPLGGPKENDDSENSMARVTTEEQANSSSRSTEENA